MRIILSILSVRSKKINSGIILFVSMKQRFCGVKE